MISMFYELVYPLARRSVFRYVEREKTAKALYNLLKTE